MNWQTMSLIFFFFFFFFICVCVCVGGKKKKKFPFALSCSTQRVCTMLRIAFMAYVTYSRSIFFLLICTLLCLRFLQGSQARRVLLFLALLICSSADKLGLFQTSLECFDERERIGSKSSCLSQPRCAGKVD